MRHNVSFGGTSLRCPVPSKKGNSATQFLNVPPDR